MRHGKLLAGARSIGPGLAVLLDGLQVRNDQSGSSGRVEVSAGVTLTGQSGASTDSTNCNGGNNASMRARVDSSVMSAATAGVYTGTAIILVEPQ